MTVIQPDPVTLLADYDLQLRGVPADPLPDGLHIERDGPLLRYTGSEHGGWVDYRDLGGLEGADLDDLIARQVGVFAARNEPFEWKLHEHDLPADLADRLREHGFVPEERETVVIAQVVAVASEPVLPEGVRLRQVTERADFDRIAEMEHAIWQDDRGWLAGSLQAERAADPDAITIVVAEAGDEVVCAAGCGSRTGRTSPRSGAAARCRSGGAAASIAPSWRTARTWPRSEASATCRWMPPTTAGPSCSAWGSSPSRRRRRTSGRPHGLTSVGQGRRSEELSLDRRTCWSLPC